jgi:hypothetical protein
MRKVSICYLFIFLVFIEFGFADNQTDNSVDIIELLKQVTRINEGWEGGGGTLSNLNHLLQFGFYEPIGTDRLEIAVLFDGSLGFGFYNDLSFDWRTGGIFEISFKLPKPLNYFGLGIGGGIGSGGHYYIRGTIPYMLALAPDGDAIKFGLYYDHFFEYGWRVGAFATFSVNLRN